MLFTFHSESIVLGRVTDKKKSFKLMVLISCANILPVYIDFFFVLNTYPNCIEIDCPGNGETLMTWPLFYILAPNTTLLFPNKTVKLSCSHQLS